MPWTKQSRAAEAARIRQNKPWLRSTGPRTTSGKAITSRNACKGGWEPKLRALAKTLRQLEAIPAAPVEHSSEPMTLDP